MKKTSILVAAAAVVLACSCGAGSTGSGMSDVLSGVVNGGTVGNVLTSVLGLDKVSKANLVGTWNYLQPGCAFTSKNLLAKAGGEVAAGTIKQKLGSYYSQVNITSQNTGVTFDENGKFAMRLMGKTISGTYTYNESNNTVQMKALLLSVTAYTKRNSNGIALLFEASKLLKFFQMYSALSGSTSVEILGDLSKNYDGLRVGFDLKK